MLESDMSPDVNTSETQCLKRDAIASQAKRWANLATGTHWLFSHNGPELDVSVILTEAHGVIMLCGDSGKSLHCWCD